MSMCMYFEPQYMELLPDEIVQIHISVDSRMLSVVTTESQNCTTYTHLRKKFTKVLNCKREHAISSCSDWQPSYLLSFVHHHIG